MALGRAATGKQQKKSAFQYKSTHDTSSMKHRASQKGGNFESSCLDHVKVFNPKEADHEFRCLPPTWENPEHFGFEIWQHYGIGPDENTYLCLAKMRDEKCPMCEERAKLNKDDPLSDALKPGKRVAVWIINRKEEAEGPMLWLMPWTFDRDMCAIAFDKKTGEVFQLDNPEEGYDVSFSVKGEGLQKKYVGIQVARRASPLHEDEDTAGEWLQYIVDNPIPEVLNYKDYTYLNDMLMGGVRGFDEKGEKKEEKDDKGKGVGDRPRIGRGGEKKKEEQELTWDDVHALDQEGLEVLVKEKELDEGKFSECEDEKEIADKVCELLGVEKPKPRGGVLGKGKEKEEEKGVSSLKERLAAMRKERGGK